jgi:hypothetical protein
VDLNRAVIRVHWQIQFNTYRHGCDDPHEYGKAYHRWPCPDDCPKAKRTAGRRHICRAWCAPKCRKHPKGNCPKLCTEDCTEHARSCPQRVGGWEFIRPKGKRKREIPIPPPLLESLKAHKAAQDAEREAAGKRWEAWDLVWCQPDGRPIHRRADWGAWKALLTAAGIQADAYRLQERPGTLPGRSWGSRA